MAAVVADTSPLIALHQLAYLSLLQRIFGEVYVPPAVANGPRASALYPSERSGEHKVRPVLDNRPCGRLRWIHQSPDLPALPDPP